MPKHTDWEDLRVRWKRKNRRGGSKTRSDLWVSFQQSRRAALSSLEHKSWKRCGTQKHNSGFPLLCNDWWNNVWQELLCPSWSCFPLYCHSCPFCSFSFLYLLAGAFLSHSLFLPLDSASLLAALLCWADGIQRANVREREVFLHSASHFIWQAWAVISLISRAAACCLSKAMDSIPKFHCLSEMYKRWGLILPPVIWDYQILTQSQLLLFSPLSKVNCNLPRFAVSPPLLLPSFTSPPLPSWQCTVFCFLMACQREYIMFKKKREEEKGNGGTNLSVHDLW